MPEDHQLTLFHGPNSRSTGCLVLLDEIGAPYALSVLNLQDGEQRQPAYLAINPMGKVPALRHDEVLITEQVAIYLYLADLFPEARLAPPVGDPLRGPYLRWMVFYAACFEPAIVDRALKREPEERAMSPYGDFDTMFATLTAQLGRGPYMLGEMFSAADVLWGTALGWVTRFKLVPETREIDAYVERIAARPASERARTKDAELAAGFAAPV